MITMLLLLGAMLAMFLVPIKTSYFAWQNSDERELAAKKQVAPEMTVTQFESAVRALNDRVAAIEPGDFETYFASLTELRTLELVGQVLEAETRDYRVRSLVMQLNSIGMSGMGNVQSKSQFWQVASTPAFVEAQRKASESSVRSLPVAPAPPEYTFTAQATAWGYAFLLTLPFALLGVFLQVQWHTGESALVVAAAFLSDWRPWAATASGPAFFITGWLLFADHPKLTVNLRYVTYAMGGILSCFIGGGVGTAKAQSPDGGAKKKSPWTFSITERVEGDEDGPVSTTMVGATYAPSGTSFEGIVVKGGAFTRTYAYATQRLKEWKGKNFSARVSAIGGLMTFKPRDGDTTVYAVTGARVWLQRGRFSWMTPHAAVEIPLNRQRSATTSAIITRPSIRITDRISVVNEWFGRFTRGAKPKVTSGLYGSFKLTNRLTAEGGVYRNSSERTGFRAQLSYSF